MFLDLTGLKCPLPVLKTRNALRTLVTGDILTVLCTDPLAAIDIPNLVRETGAVLREQGCTDETLRFVIEKTNV